MLVTGLYLVSQPARGATLRLCKKLSGQVTIFAKLRKTAAGRNQSSHLSLDREVDKVETISLDG